MFALQPYSPTALLQEQAQQPCSIALQPDRGSARQLYSPVKEPYSPTTLPAMRWWDAGGALQRGIIANVQATREDLRNSCKPSERKEITSMNLCKPCGPPLGISATGASHHKGKQTGNAQWLITRLTAHVPSSCARVLLGSNAVLPRTSGGL